MLSCTLLFISVISCDNLMSTNKKWDNVLKGLKFINLLCNRVKCERTNVSRPSGLSLKAELILKRELVGKPFVACVAVASPQTSFGVCLSRIHFSVGEKWMRDKQTPKDVCGEASVAGAKRGGRGGGRKARRRGKGREPFPSLPYPPFFSLFPYHLPLSTPATQASPLS